ncbi:hypothetical protein BDZ89DRAFT_1068386 [Hymenopellis radicata]|nr:hypothetical protein BDZ89DRAFT_1068386 [Hymenopellis radicata]
MDTYRPFVSNHARIRLVSPGAKLALCATTSSVRSITSGSFDPCRRLTVSTRNVSSGSLLGAFHRLKSRVAALLHVAADPYAFFSPWTKGTSVRRAGANETPCLGSMYRIALCTGCHRRFWYYEMYEQSSSHSSQRSSPPCFRRTALFKYGSHHGTEATSTPDPSTSSNAIQILDFMDAVSDEANCVIDRNSCPIYK